MFLTDFLKAWWKHILTGVILVAVVLVGFVFPGQCLEFLEKLDAWVDGASGDKGSYGESLIDVHFVDVGQAKAIVVDVPDGGTMLIDAGSNESEPKLMAYLDTLDIDFFDMVVLTHPHEDHIGGADRVLDEYFAATVLIPDEMTATASFEDMLEALDGQRKMGSSIAVAKRGQVYRLGEAYVTVLAAESLMEGEDENNASIVLGVEHGNASAIFTGDAEARIEDILVGMGDVIDSDLLDAGHHGSDTSSGEAFIEAVSPKVVVISCGKDNAYGHPAVGVLERFDGMEIPVYRTDEDGTVVVSLLPDDGVSVKALGKERW